MKKAQHRGQSLSYKAERAFWIPYCGYGPGWCARAEACRGDKVLLEVFGEPVSCRFLRRLHPWTGLAAEEFRAIVEYAYRCPLKVRASSSATKPA